MQYTCPPLSRQQLRNYAYEIRKTLGLDNTPWLPAPHLLESLPRLINDENFYFHVVEDDEGYLDPRTHAAYFPNDNCIRIRGCVYDSACDGNGRDRMTIVHEIAHVLLLKHSSIQFHRSFSKESVKAYCDPEWQAKCLAGELMVPYHLVRNRSAVDISKICGVSQQAAEYQKKTFK